MTDSGIHKNLLRSFLELAGTENTQIVPLVDNDTVRVVPVTIQKDGMALKPGMQVDARQGKVIGTTDAINYKYIRENPNRDPEKLNNLFVTETMLLCHDARWTSDATHWCRLYPSKVRWRVHIQIPGREGSVQRNVSSPLDIVPNTSHQWCFAVFESQCLQFHVP